MADNQAQLSIVIKAIDEASATLKQMADNTAAATNEAKGATEGFGSSLARVFTNVTEYVAAYQIMEKAEEAIKGFFEEAIGGAMEAGDTLAQLKVDVDNAGMSYDQVGPKVEELAKQHLALGFSTEDTEGSLGKLLLTTHNYGQAVALNNLAMDLARNKHISLAEATTLVEEVMAGNTRALKTYGISLDSATTSAEALDMLQKQVKGSAEAAAETTAGKWREVQAQWHEIEQQFGEQILPVLGKVFDAFNDNLPEIINDVQDLIGGINAFANATGVIPLIAEDFRELSEILGGLRDTWDDLTGRMDEYATAHQKLAPRVKDAIDAHNALHSSLQITEKDFKNMDLKTQESFMRQYGSATDKTSNSFDGIANRIGKADNAVVKHSEAVAKLSDEYDKMAQTGLTDLADLESAFQSKMESINKSIQDTSDKIIDLSTSYAQTQQDDVTRVADDIVASAQKIEDLKHKIGQATTSQQANELDQQLNKEQLNYQSSLNFRQQHLAQIAIAETRAKQTDLQREIDDYNKKQDLDTLQYQKKLATLQQQLKDQQAEAKQEEELFKQKVLNIAKVLDQGQTYFNKLSAERVSTTTNEVNQEIAQFQRLSAAIGGIKSASLMSLPSASIVPHFADGGIVTSPTIGLIGEAGPEAIIPLSQTGGFGGTNFNITITGNTISNKLDIRSIAEAVSAEIVRIYRLHGKLAI